MTFKTIPMKSRGFAHLFPDALDTKFTVYAGHAGVITVSTVDAPETATATETAPLALMYGDELQNNGRGHFLVRTGEAVRAEASGV